jgi:hypothetical protein
LTCLDKHDTIFTSLCLEIKSAKQEPEQISKPSAYRQAGNDKFPIKSQKRNSSLVIETFEH